MTNEIHFLFQVSLTWRNQKRYSTHEYLMYSLHWHMTSLQ